MSEPPVTYVTIDPREQVQWPAMLLVGVGVVGILLQLFGILGNLLGLSIGAAAAREAPEIVGQLMSGAVGLAIAVLGILVGVFVIFGGLRMRELRSYAVSMVAAIVAMVPCVSPCCCLGLPVGVWALVVLLKPGVRDAFR